MPLFFAGISFTLHAQERQVINGTITYKNNVFEVNDAREIVMVEDPLTGMVDTRVENPEPIPVKMNNLMIYSVKDVSTPSNLNHETLKTLILPALQKNILLDGVYRIHINNVILNEKGKIAYYDYGGVEKRTGTKVTKGEQTFMKYDYADVDKKTVEAIGKQIELIIDKAPAYTPAKVGQMTVVYRVPVEGLKQPFAIKAGQITFLK